MATLYWYGGTGNWSSATGHWSTNSGNSPAADHVAPTSSDDVIFDTLSNATGYTVTVDVSSVCNNLTMGAPLSGNVTWAGSSALAISGNLNLSGGANITRTYTGTITFNATSGTKTITSNGIILDSFIILNGSGGTFQLIDTLTTDKDLTLTAGAFDANNQTVVLNGNGATTAIIGSFTFYNLTLAGINDKADVFTFNSNVTISNIFTVNGNSAINRILIQSNTIATPRTLNAASVVTKWADWMDIIGAGAANWDLTVQATDSSGDCGGNTGITFTTADTETWNNASSGNWSTAANWTGGTISRVPLPQDTVSMNKAFGTSQTVTADMPRLGKSIDWTGATWTTGLTWTNSVPNSIFGSLTMINNLTLSGANTLAFGGRGSFTFTSNSLTFGRDITLNAPTGTLTLGGNLTMGTTRRLSISNGTFSVSGSNYVISTGLFTLSGGILTLGTGTHLITGTGTTTWNVISGTLNANTSTIKITGTSNSAITFVGGGKTYWNVYFSRGVSTAINTITGTNIFNDFKDDGTGAHTIVFPTGNPTVVTTFTVSNTSNLTTLQSSSAGTRFTIFASGGTINSDYLNLVDSLVGGGATWNAGAHSTFSTGNYFGLTFGWQDAPTTTSGRWWVSGGTGNYNSTTNWATSDGGASGASVPIGEKVFFTVTPGNVTATVNVTSTAGDIDFTGFIGILAGSSALSIFGNITLVSSMTNSYTGTITLASTATSKTITSGTITFGGAMTLSGSTTSGFQDIWTLQDNFNVTTKTFTLTAGIFSANNFTFRAGIFSSSNSNVRTITMGNKTWSLDVTTASALWTTATTTNLTLNVNTSTIKFIDTGNNTQTFSGGGSIFNNIYFSRGSGTGAITILGANTFADFKDDGTGTHTITFPNLTTAVTSWNVNGTSGHLITLQRTGASGTWTISDSAGTNSSSYVSISNSTATGGATWNANDGTSTNGGGNTGWNFSGASVNSGMFLVF